ncbi:MAG: CbtA family protein, partial [Thiohalocapsa sp.]
IAVLSRLLCAALCGGLVAGVVAAAAHQIATVPLIQQAESYERQADWQGADHAHHAAAAPTHDHAIPVAGQAWEPEDGFERTAATVAADLLAAIGFALLLAAGLALRGGAVTWRDGLFWGLAGFAAFTVAPGLGLPPEIPGAAAAPLAARQAWWITTAAATGLGLALLAFTRHAVLAAFAVLLILLPHLYGAPLPADNAADMAPAALAHRFVAAATTASLVFWAVLGAAIGYFYRRFIPEQR